MNINNSIKATKDGFEQSFKEGSMYNKQTQDDSHIKRILEILPLGQNYRTNHKANQRILDLGTGSGYLAFTIAKEYPDVQVVGLDIVEETLKRNRERAEKEGLHNLNFVSYDGIHFPFSESDFDIVTTRYALHHFPKIQATFKEVSKVLKSDGYFFVSDPTPNENDEERFVDQYMQMKKDGHIKYYTKEEFTHLAQSAGLEFIEGFETEITFPRLRETAFGFDEIIKNSSDKVVAGYQVKMSEDQQYIYITQRVLNLLFKCAAKR